MSNKNKKEPLLELFKFDEMDCHYFEELESSFWDSENIMEKNYKTKKKKIKEENLVDNDLLSLESAHKTLLNSKLRQTYCKYLMYQYTLIQPINMNLLIEKYYSIIFPYYLFLSDNNKFIVLDNINFSVNFYENNALKNSFEVDTIENIKLNNNEKNLKIKIIKNKNEIIFVPQIEDQLYLVYSLILFMSVIKKKKENWKKGQSKVNEINQNLVKETIETIFDNNKNLYKKISDFKLLILSNDSFVPKGIKYCTFVEDKNSSIPKKYMSIGTSYIYLFKDEEMNDILNIIPLVPGSVMFEFNEKERNIKVTTNFNKYNFFFKEIEAYNNILKVIMNISEAEDELLDQDELDKVSEFLFKDKIMGGDLKNTPLLCKSEKDLAILDIKIDNLKRAKADLEEKGLIYQIINKKEKIEIDVNNEYKIKIENSIENDKKENKEENKEEKKEEIKIEEAKKEEEKNEIIENI